MPAPGAPPGAGMDGTGPVGRLLPSGAVVMGVAIFGMGMPVSVGALTEREGGAALTGGVSGGGVTGMGGFGGADASGGGVTGVGGVGADDVGRGGGGVILPVVDATSSADGGGGGFAGAVIGAERASGMGSEGGSDCLTSKGCVTAAWAPWAAGRSTKRSEAVGRFTRTGAGVPSACRGRPGAATTPVVVGAGGAGCDNGGCGGMVEGARAVVGAGDK